MDAGESDGRARKRTESIGAGSESDASDGWNFVEHTDATQPDIPSSDGESVEVIEAEDSAEQAEEQVSVAEDVVATAEEPTASAVIPTEAAEVVPTEAAKVVPTEAAEVLPSAAPTTTLNTVVPTVQPEPPAVLPVRENVFDTPFCWFLFFSVAAVVVSNVVFMAAEGNFRWNMDNDILDSTPSFLHDLPVTPKLPAVEKPIKPVITTVKDSTSRETVEDLACAHNLANGIQQMATDQDAKSQNGPQNPKMSSNVDNLILGKYFKYLSDASGSENVQQNFAQSLLILDALQIGLNDLEEVVTENNELKNTVTTQKEQLQDVLKEIESGVFRAMDKIASNILYRVQNLERSFENQWCQLEKSGHKEDLKGLFYECPDFNDDAKPNHKHDSRRSEPTKQEEKNKKRFTGKDSYQYEVDKDSTGKYYSKSDGKLEEKEYNKFESPGNPPENSYKKDKSRKYEKSFKNDHDKNPKENNQNTAGNNKPIDSNREKVYQKSPETYKTKENFKYETKTVSGYAPNVEKDFKASDKQYQNNQKFDKNKDYYKEKKVENFVPEADFVKKEFESKQSEGDSNKPAEPEEQSKYRGETRDDRKFRFENNHKEKSVLDKISKYLKDACKKIGDKAKSFKAYEKLKNSVIEKAKIPVDVFNNMYQKYCKNSEYNSRENGFKDNLKGESRGKTYEKKEFSKNSPVIIDQNSNNGHILEVVETTDESSGYPTRNNREKVIEAKRNRQWTFSYEVPPTNNKTKYTGDWFFKAGDARSKARWSHQRSDWLFDRASNRRQNPHYAEKRKNWFFRRAYARQQCRDTPHGKWCDFQHSENPSVTLPSSRFR